MFILASEILPTVHFMHWPHLFSLVVTAIISVLVSLVHLNLNFYLIKCIIFYFFRSCGLNLFRWRNFEKNQIKSFCDTVRQVSCYVNAFAYLCRQAKLNSACVFLERWRTMWLYDRIDTCHILFIRPFSFFFFRLAFSFFAFLTSVE